MALFVLDRTHASVVGYSTKSKACARHAFARFNGLARTINTEGGHGFRRTLEGGARFRSW